MSPPRLIKESIYIGHYSIEHLSMKSMMYVFPPVAYVRSCFGVYSNSDSDNNPNLMFLYITALASATVIEIQTSPGFLKFIPACPQVWRPSC